MNNDEGLAEAMDRSHKEGQIKQLELRISVLERDMNYLIEWKEDQMNKFDLY